MPGGSHLSSGVERLSEFHKSQGFELEVCHGQAIRKLILPLGE